ncbi:hypothetical protein BD769DRAFT_1390558 [Suillus cothurnatus]|nr:hypothetical protein BD769DRAFT_1390558 [Suillus cothurnatus]
MHTEMPGVLDDWLEAQNYIIKAGPLVLDNSVIKPESEPSAEDLVLVSSTGQLVDVTDNSMTESKSDPEFRNPVYQHFYLHHFAKRSRLHNSKKIGLDDRSDQVIVVLSRASKWTYHDLQFMTCTLLSHTKEQIHL